MGSSPEAAARVYRGGSWNNNPRNLRSANRNRNAPGNADNNLGFRLALPAHRENVISLDEPENVSFLQVIESAGQKTASFPRGLPNAALSAARVPGKNALQGV